MREEIDDIKYDKVNYLEFDELERDIAEVQHIRRNNIEIYVQYPRRCQRSWTNYYQNMYNSLRSDIEACHRLHKKANHNQEPRNVIVVRFVNRGKM